FADNFPLADTDVQVSPVYATLPQSVNEDGFPVLGDPNAPVEILQFSSFSCPHCAAFHRDSFPQLLPYIEAGSARYVFIPMQTGSIPGAQTAFRDAYCTADQSYFFQFADV